MTTYSSRELGRKKRFVPSISNIRNEVRSGYVSSKSIVLSMYSRIKRLKKFSMALVNTETVIRGKIFGTFYRMSFSTVIKYPLFKDIWNIRVTIGSCSGAEFLKKMKNLEGVPNSYFQHSICAVIPNREIDENVTGRF